jgi:pimeloyl-ACP methyl ester carboxylesterase
MKRLGYTRYVAQGGDWGAGVVQAMGRQAPGGLLGIHSNLPAALPPEVAAALAGGGPAPTGLSEEERASFDALRASGRNRNLAYVTMMGARPQAVGYGLTDSPAGLAGWMLVHPGFAQWAYGKDPKQTPTVDEVLDNFTLYWLTNSSSSAARLYGRTAQEPHQFRRPEDHRDQGTRGQSPRSRRRSSASRRRGLAAPSPPDLLPQGRPGGHFAAWEHPELFTQELRGAFRPLRKTH